MDLVTRLFGHVEGDAASAVGLVVVIVVAGLWLVRRSRRRSAVFPIWEPVPWDAPARVAREQKTGFRKRAKLPIGWRAVPWTSFPAEGVFGHDRDWFSTRDVACFATFRGEELILIRNTWHGWPDPPEWGLASRPIGLRDPSWSPWGCFAEIPAAWNVPPAEPVRSFAGGYVHVEDDGSVRELEPFELDYLNTDFHGADGARPYIKRSYAALAPDGRISGFLRREDLPASVRVKSALEGTVPIQTADQAIAVAKIAITNYVRHVVVDPDALGAFSAELEAGIWRVTRVPEATETRTPPPVTVTLPYVVRLSAASGRIVGYGW